MRKVEAPFTLRPANTADPSTSSANPVPTEMLGKEAEPPEAMTREPEALLMYAGWRSAPAATHSVPPAGSASTPPVNVPDGSRTVSPLATVIDADAGSSTRVGVLHSLANVADAGAGTPHSTSSAPTAIAVN